ncbi:NADH dehydrogenase [ubiquinone] 1 beta subcomplex subunit 2, mitochondrial-like [Artemia franciscana]|uniref:NADH dehydrogenase [ubiquinone] 1 beta subcomplex subunit 2, mitochondrial-like n=1 Tax=Artemia franciscana TaxID=6661 RepID=UPI0032DB5A70
MFQRIFKAQTFSVIRKQCISTSQPKFGGRAGYVYRESTPTISSQTQNLTEALGAVFWWWVLYNLWKDPGHVFGEFDIPDPAKWTDEELGVSNIE